MFCKNCGKEINEGATFCPECGMPVNSVQSEKREVNTDNGAGKLNKRLVIGVGIALAAVFLIAVVSISVRLFGKNPEETAAVMDDKKDDTDVIEETVYKYFTEEIHVGDIVTFGSYEQDGDLSNGKEPISWYVLENANNRYLLLSQYVLDCQPWDDGSAKASGALAHEADVEYDKCSLRKWLTDSFSAEAFGEEELQYIQPVSFRGDEMTVAENNEYATDYAFLMDFYYATDLSGGQYTKSNTDKYGHTEITYFMIGPWLISAPTEYAIQQGVPVYSYGTCVNKFASLQIEDWDLSSTRTTYPMDYAPWFIRQIDEYSPWYLRTLWKIDESYENAVFQVSEIGQYLATEPRQSLGVRPAIYISIPAELRASWEPDESAIQEAKEHLTLYNGTYYSEYFEGATLTISSDGIELTGPNLYTYMSKDWAYTVEREELEGQIRLDSLIYYVDENGYDCFYDKSDEIKLVFNSDDNMLSFWVEYKTAAYDSNKYNVLRGQPLGWIELAQYKKQ